MPPYSPELAKGAPILVVSWTWTTILMAEPLDGLKVEDHLFFLLYYLAIGKISSIFLFQSVSLERYEVP